MSRSGAAAGYLVLLLGLTTACLGGPTLAQVAQKGSGTQDAENAHNKALYDANCALCHGPEAKGGQFAAALRGEPFLTKWGRQPAALWSFIAASMPPGQGGTLRDGDYRAITAYVLQVNGTNSAGRLPAASESAGPAPALDAPPPNVAVSPFNRAELNHDAIYQRETARKNAILRNLAPVTDKVLQAPPDGDWLMWRRAYSALGFSPLKQITRQNASGLRLAWSWALYPSQNEITPLVHDGVLFIHSGAAAQAFDGISGELLWQYVRKLPDSLQGGRTARSKGIAIYGSALYLPTVDGHVISLDARTGKLLWEKRILTPEQLAQGVQLNGVPTVVKGKVMMGISQSLTVKGGCYIFALDAQTGEEVWRFNTVAQPGELGGDSWNGVPAEQRFGGAQWTGGSYDPDLNLVYFGTGNTYNTATLIRPDADPAPSNAGLFTESTIALDPDTGRLAWYFQHMSRDVWDMDWAYEQSLIDLPVDGKIRKLVVTGGKMALFDGLDRSTGRYIWSRDPGLQNIVTAVDPVTGAKSYNPALRPVSGETKLICPGSSGFRNWMATAFDPRTNILYIPMFENCGDFTWTQRSASETALGGIDQHFKTRQMPGGDGNFGRLQAINLQSGKTLWTKRQRARISSSILTTAGGVMFEGSGDRYFRARDQANGDVLWQTRLSSTASSSPITYSVKGTQYVAVVTGGGNPQDTGWASLAPEISNPSSSPVLWVFRLPFQNDRTAPVRGSTIVDTDVGK